MNRNIMNFNIWIIDKINIKQIDFNVNHLKGLKKYFQQNEDNT